MANRARSPFNSALETGTRSLVILAASVPNALDLNRLVQFDYLTVHSADAGGPPSLHPPIPLRSGELLVRRGLIERGLNLMISRRLVQRLATESGFLFEAEDDSGAFLSSLTAPYLRSLQDRAEWVVAQFGALDPAQLDAVVRRLFSAWTTQFQLSDTGPLPGAPS